MTPRDSLAIAAAALRWSTARERRLAAGAEKRKADAAYKAHSVPGSAAVMFLAASSRLRIAEAVLDEAQRHERSATRALAKACAKARGDLQAADAFHAAQPAVLLAPGMTLEMNR